MTDEPDLDALRAALDPFARKTRESELTPLQERLLADFDEIRDFVREHGRAPASNPPADIFERIYAVRLQRMARMPEARELLASVDDQGLLAAASGEGQEAAATIPDADELAGALRELAPEDMSALRHVRPAAARQPAEDVAERRKCEDFERFAPLFGKVREELKSGLLETRRFGRDAGIRAGEFFILHGQIIYVASAGREERRTRTRRPDRRLRVIYDNGMESDILMRSLQRALYKDKSGRRIIVPDHGPLFGGEQADGDVRTGVIYVARSKAGLPFVREYGDLLHKIGVTTGDVEGRIANARNDPTFLMAEAEIVALYKLANIDPPRLEKLFHRLFGAARLNVEIKDRFGKPVKPREWFLVPLPVIDDSVKKIRNGEIDDYVYDPQQARLVKKRGGGQSPRAG